MNSQPIVELRDVSKSFGGCPVLGSINFSIHPGESISVCGASGTGKTTLLNIIGSLERPDSGTVFWNGEAVSSKRARDICSARCGMFGFIFQSHNLICELNVLENVLLPLRVRKCPSKEDTNFADSLLEAVGMGGKRCGSIDTLSGGERQRVALARALVSRPRLVLADEPTGNLDEINAQGALNLMVNICRQSGSSLLLITHNQRLAKLTDQNFTLSNGQLLPQ